MHYAFLLCFSYVFYNSEAKVNALFKICIMRLCIMRISTVLWIPTANESSSSPVSPFLTSSLALLCSDYTLTQICQTASFPFSLTPHTVAHVQYDLTTSFDILCMIWSGDFIYWFLYNINLGAIHTMIPSTRGVEIHISLVSSATDSIQWCVVVFKTVTVPTSDLKSEFLCQSCYNCAQKGVRLLLFSSFSLFSVSPSRTFRNVL